MLKYPLWKIWVILIICITFVILALPNFTSYRSKVLPQKTVNYGLDLKGGSQVLLEVDFDKYLSQHLLSELDVIRGLLRKAGVFYTNLKVIDKKISFSIKNSADLPKMQKALTSLDFNIKQNSAESLNILLEHKNEHLLKMRDGVIEQSRETIRYRIDENGTLEPSIASHGNYGIMIQVPGLSDPEQLRRMLGKTAQLTLNLVENVFSEDNKPRILSHDKKLVMGEHGSYYVVQRTPVVTGNMLVDARFVNSNGQPVVSFNLNPVGAKVFGDATKINQNRRLAIILDDRVISAPVINEPILSGSGVISGNFTINEANELALLLRAGALPAPLKIIEEKIVGPALGEDSIALGKKSGAIAVSAIVLAMILLYSAYGVFASIALGLNLVIIIAVMTTLQATLTMPGIAGIILTMGMAVDANVLIFERIRDEPLKSKSFSGYAIEKGFEKAFTTIFDSNFTTLIAAFFLYAFGSGVVKGFAVTLTVGILSSMFTAITVTKMLIYFWTKTKRPSHS